MVSRGLLSTRQGRNASGLRLRRTAAAVLVGLSLAAGSAGAAPAKPAFSIDDVLRLEGFGRALVSPDGAAVIFVQKPPYADYPDFSLEIHWDIAFGRLMEAAATGEAAARPLLPDDPTAIHALLGLSPSGRHVAFLEAKAGRLRLGVVDRRSGGVRYAEDAPVERLTHDMSPVWLSDERLAFAAEAPGAPTSYLPYYRRGAAEAQDAGRRKSWAGHEPSAGVYVSRAVDPPRQAQAGRLVILDVVTGAVTTLADGLYSDLRLSPDGRRLAATQAFTDVPKPAVGLGNAWTYSRSSLAVFDLASGVRHDASPGLDLHTGTAEWSPDSRRIAYFGWPDDGAAERGQFRIFDLASNHLRALPHTGLDLVSEREFGPRGRPFRAAWLGDTIAVVARPNPDGDPTPKFTTRGVTGRERNVDPGRFDWYRLGPGAPQNLTARAKAVSPWLAGNTARGAFVILDGHVSRLDPTGRLAEVVSGPELRDEAVPSTRGPAYPRPAFPPTAVFATRAGDRWMKIDFAAPRLAATPVAAGEGDPIAPAPDGAALVLLRQDGDGTALTLAGVHGTRDLARVNRVLADRQLPASRPITYAGAGGTPVTSCLITPVGPAPAGGYPTIVYAYPDSRPPCPTTQEELLLPYYGNLSAFAAAGYAVLSVTSRGISTAEGGPLDGLAAATDRAIDAAAATGLVDPRRLGVFGASGAGFSGLWLATQSRRFKAIVSINGIADLQSHFFSSGVSNYFYPENTEWKGQAARYESHDQFGLGFTPWDDPAYYWKISPVAHARDITAPILLFGTDMDVAGFDSQYDEMFTALSQLRKNADYVKYWGERHGPISPANIRDLFDRSVAWFDRYLKADGAPP